MTAPSTKPGVSSNGGVSMSGKTIWFWTHQGGVNGKTTFKWKCLQRGKLRITIIRHRLIFIFISTQKPYE